MKNILILHGWGQHSGLWDNLRKMYAADGFIVHAWDLPGFGNEPTKTNCTTIPDYSNWVEQKIKHEKIDKNLYIIGHSFGGRIASYLTSKNPTYLSGLILHGAPSLYRPSLKTRIKILLAKILKIFKIKKTALKNQELLTADSGGLGKIFRNVVLFDQTLLLPNITTPTLLIWGEYDTAVPVSIAKKMHQIIPGSELFIIKNYGHSAYRENIYLFYGITKNFIENH